LDPVTAEQPAKELNPGQRSTFPCRAVHHLVSSATGRAAMSGACHSRPSAD
jgi:hypothetical protein